MAIGASALRKVPTSKCKSWRATARADQRARLRMR